MVTHEGFSTEGLTLQKRPGMTTKPPTVYLWDPFRDLSILRHGWSCASYRTSHHILDTLSVLIFLYCKARELALLSTHPPLGSSHKNTMVPLLYYQNDQTHSIEWQSPVLSKTSIVNKWWTSSSSFGQYLHLRDLGFHIWWCHYFQDYYWDKKKSTFPWSWFR